MQYLKSAFIISIALNLFFIFSPKFSLKSQKPSETIKKKLPGETPSEYLKRTEDAERSAQIKALIQANIQCEQRYAKRLVSTIKENKFKDQNYNRQPTESAEDYLKRMGL
ncbi:MAG: hypothetical protein IPM57_10440 [Oligoflexia bacterium]|nr:hypothetical protein [Oligoflexia bacterium]